MRILISLSILLLSISSHSQQFSPDYQSNPSYDFQTFLSGVRYAYLELSEHQLQNLRSKYSKTDSLVFSGIIQYLNATGFEKVEWGNRKSVPTNLPSRCQLAVIKPEWTMEGSAVTELVLKYNSCLNDQFEFVSRKRISTHNKKDIALEVSKNLKQLHGLRKPEYNPANKLSLQGEQTGWDAKNLSEYFLENGVKGIEGIYESSTLNRRGERLLYGVVKNEHRYDVIYLAGADNYLDWNTGEIQAKLIPTAGEYIFRCDWIMPLKNTNLSLYLNFENAQMNTLESTPHVQRCIKIFPTALDLANKKGRESVSGTGFAVSADGSIVTSYHVVNDADSVFVTQKFGDRCMRYKAKVVLADRNNDLAILKIDDKKFLGFGDIPYSFAQSTGDLGNSVFVLGYPMRTTMGEQIKLTTGVVSSVSGFKDDITNFQISASVQPGNSGGPVFNQNGELIGVVSSRHASAENVSYAVKIQYLTNLISLYPALSECTQQSSVDNQSLTSTVNSVSPFVFIVEAFKN